MAIVGFGLSLYERVLLLVIPLILTYVPIIELVLIFTQLAVLILVYMLTSLFLMWLKYCLGLRVNIESLDAEQMEEDAGLRTSLAREREGEGEETLGGTNGGGGGGGSGGGGGVGGGGGLHPVNRRQQANNISLSLERYVDPVPMPIPVVNHGVESLRPTSSTLAAEMESQRQQDIARLTKLNAKREPVYSLTSESEGEPTRTAGYGGSTANPRLNEQSTSTKDAAQTSVQPGKNGGAQTTEQTPASDSQRRNESTPKPVQRQAEAGAAAKGAPSKAETPAKSGSISKTKQQASNATNTVNTDTSTSASIKMVPFQSVGKLSNTKSRTFHRADMFKKPPPPKPVDITAMPVPSPSDDNLPLIIAPAIEDASGYSDSERSASVSPRHQGTSSQVPPTNHYERADIGSSITSMTEVTPPTTQPNTDQENQKQNNHETLTKPTKSKIT